MMVSRPCEAMFHKHIVGSQFKGSRYKGLYVLLPLIDFKEKLMDFYCFNYFGGPIRISAGRGG